MPIELKEGDILHAEADALVNPVNCVGVMGAGLALQFKTAWPENFAAYADECRKGKIRPGSLFVFPTGHPVPKYIINFPTKRHWREKSRLEDIVAGLKTLVLEVKRLGITSIAVPMLGTGLGGLPREAVQPFIEQYLGSLGDNVRVLLFTTYRNQGAQCQEKNDKKEGAPHEPQLERSAF